MRRPRQREAEFVTVVPMAPGVWHTPLFAVATPIWGQMYTPIVFIVGVAQLVVLNGSRSR